MEKAPRGGTMRRMLNVNDLRRVTWRRRSAAQSYEGYLVVTDEFVRLIGREEATGIDASLSIPHSAITSAYAADDGDLVLDVADGIPILVHPVGGQLALTTLARRIVAAASA
jgi:hypothetical protein